MWSGSQPNNKWQLRCLRLSQRIYFNIPPLDMISKVFHLRLRLDKKVNGKAYAIPTLVRFINLLFMLTNSTPIFFKQTDT